MDQTQTRQKVREFVTRFIRNHEVADDENYFAGGFVNSMFAMQLVQFVEQTFGIAVESEDLEIDNFCSVNAVTALVERKQGAAV